MISEKVHLFNIVYMQSLSCFHLPSSVDQPVGSLLPVNDFQKEDTPWVATSKWRVLWDMLRLRTVLDWFLYISLRKRKNYKKSMVFWCILPELLKFHGFSTRCSHICPILIFPATPNLILLMLCRSFIAWDWSGGIPCSWPWQRYLRPGFLKSWGITSRDGVTYTKSWSCLMT